HAYRHSRSIPCPPPNHFLLQTTLRSTLHFSFLLIRRPPTSPLFPYTTLFRSNLSPLIILGWLALILYTTLASVNWDLTKAIPARSEEHTSELQSRENLVCRLLLEKKKYKQTAVIPIQNQYNRRHH